MKLSFDNGQVSFFPSCEPAVQRMHLLVTQFLGHSLGTF